MKGVKSCVLLVLLFVGYLSSFPQANEQGIKPYGSFHGGDLDQISVSNGHLELRIPLLSYPQRGNGLKLTFIARFHNAVWNEHTDCAPTTGICLHIWEYDNLPGVSVVTEEATPFIDQQLISGGNTQNPVYAYSVRLADESQHPLGNTATNTFETLDATGARWNSSTQTVTLSDGTRYAGIFGSTPILEDANGNQISLGSSIIDTMGRNIPWPGGSGSTQDFSGCTGALPTSSATLWLVPGSNGSSNTFKFCFAQVQIYTHHWSQTSSGKQQYIEPHSAFSMLQSIVLPDQTAWTFDYSQPDANGINWGDLVKVTLPAGGTLSYTWGHVQGCHVAFGSKGSWSGGATQRTVNAQDGTGPHTWIYGVGSVAGQKKVTDPLGNDTVHTFTDLNTSCSLYETKTEFYQGTQTSGTPLKTVVTDYSWGVNPNLPSPAPAMNVVPIRVTTSWPSSVTKKTEYAYDSGFAFNAGTATGIYGKRTSVKDFDYGNNAPGALLRSTQTDYLWQVPAGSQYSTYNILDVPTVTTLKDGAGITVAQTSIAYDASAPGASGISTSHDLTPPNGNVRGNPTSTSRWLSGSTVSTPNCPVAITNGLLTTTKTFLDTGVISQSTDACGHQTSLQYSSIYAGAYLTNSCDALNHCTTTEYNLNTGALASIKDPNGQATGKKTTLAYDDIGRLSSITYPDGGQTTAFYPNATTVEVKKLQDSSANLWIDTYTYFDGLLRMKQTRLVDPEGDVYSETTYDALGRTLTATNPHRSVAAPTDGTTTNQHDLFGRITGVLRPDGNILQTNYTDPDIVTLIDETSRPRRQTQDALGRLIKVEEPSGNTAPYSLDSPAAWPTLYSYDLLGNLTGVEQHGNTSDSAQWRVRSFHYDSLSRMTQSYNPETGQLNYTYDANGNVIGRSDARGVTMTYSYDIVNRPLQETYSDGTPTATFAYDQATSWGVNLMNTIGRLSSTTAGSTGSIVSYDAMGRPTAESVCLPSNCGTSSYAISTQYDLAGHLTSLTYPSSRTITTAYNAAGRPTNSALKSFNGQSLNYPYYSVPQAGNAAGWGYHPNGALHLGTFGNGISETYGLNSRGQLNAITASGASQTWLSKIYGFYDSSNHNNGIIWSITDGISSTRNQFYQYDALGRVTSGYQQDGAFNQTFNYDPWGNMIVSGTNSFTPLFDGANRVSGAPVNCTGANEYCYDIAGNMMNDGFHQYAYDGSNRVKSVDGIGATYVYAATGERIRKETGGKVTEYIYFQGLPIAEKDVSTGYWSDYVFFNGRRIARANNFEHQIHTSGQVCTNCGPQWYQFNLTNLGSLAGYTVKSGDTLRWLQWQNTGSAGGIVISFTDGTDSCCTAGPIVSDQNGEQIAKSTIINQWNYRVANLSNVVGKTISQIRFYTDGTTQPGQWDIYYQDLVFTGADGAVRPLFSQNGSGPSASGVGSAGMIQTSLTIHDCSSPSCTPAPINATTYFHGDQIGSARLLSAGYGYPVWQGTFTPFGQEVSPQITNNHYKFNGKERGEDGEGGADYFGARSYSSVIGRWMTPDWSELPSPVPYARLTNPQSLNLYSYVTDDPLSRTDVDGHFQSAPANQPCPNNNGNSCQVSTLFTRHADVDNNRVTLTLVVTTTITRTVGEEVVTTTHTETTVATYTLDTGRFIEGTSQYRSQTVDQNGAKLNEYTDFSRDHGKSAINEQQASQLIGNKTIGENAHLTWGEASGLDASKHEALVRHATLLAVGGVCIILEPCGLVAEGVIFGAEAANVVHDSLKEDK